LGMNSIFAWYHRHINPYLTICVCALIFCVTSLSLIHQGISNQERDNLAKSQISHTESGIWDYIVELNVFKIEFQYDEHLSDFRNLPTIFARPTFLH